MESLFYLGIIILAAMMTAAVVSRVHLPDVTGYLLAGLLIGPSVLRLIPAGIISDFEIVSQVALAFIAYGIGAEMNIDHLKSLGKRIFIITFFEAFIAFLVVFIVMRFGLGQTLPFSLVLAAISSATAPAATLMVIKQYHASGPLVDTLIPIVALDDAFCIMIFGIASTISLTLLKGSALSVVSMILIPLAQIFGALLLGAAAGALSTLVVKRQNTQERMTSYILATVLILTYVSVRFSLSSLLVMMSFGISLCNLSPGRSKARVALDGISAPILVVFFTLSGADLDLSVFSKVGLLAAVYIFARSSGKFMGAGFGCKLTKTDNTVAKYLGFTLFPQAGVAIGLSLIAEHMLPASYGAQIRAITLAATVIYELMGPVITKIALIKAGEIRVFKPKKSVQIS